MSVVIESITLPTTEKRLVLNAAQWGATLDVGTAWTRLRIGARVAVANTLADLLGTPRLYMGVCSDPVSGFTNGPLSGASTKHYVGRMPTDPTWTWTNAAVDYYTVSSQQVGRKVGTVETMAGGSSSSRFSADPAVSRRINMFEIGRQVTNWDVDVSTQAVAAIGTDHTEADMRTAMETSSFSAACTDAGLSTVGGTLVIDEVTDGDLNAICIGWDKSATDFHISEMFFSILE
jgi:hypothetical protein